jgi:hypothetical protein
MCSYFVHEVIGNAFRSLIGCLNLSVSGQGRVVGSCKRDN